MSRKIHEIEVQGLWGLYDIRWELNAEVNVLSGGNGTGKSTVLRSVGEMFRDGKISERHRRLIERIDVTFDDGTHVSSEQKIDPKDYNVQIVSTFDTAAIEGDSLNKLSGGEVTTELDMALFMLHTKYLNYQLEVSQEMINALSDGKPTCEILSHKERFFDIIDSLFELSGKTINRRDNALSFTKGNKKITPYQLSSGEKQILIILTSVLVCNQRPITMLMDEPEISLHFDWQRRLIDDILAINPNTQLIISTHSPAVVMRGWIDRVVEITDIIYNVRDKNL